MGRILVSASRDPFYNLAFENILFERASCGFERDMPILYLWRNSDVVVIGRFQNPWKECALERMEKDGVALMRRDTGGGAVFHDEQNICFSFVTAAESDYRAKNTALICSALQTLGFNARPSGRNDITVEEAKISGAAYREKNGVCLHHGTILTGTDLERLAAYLNPDQKKLESKGIPSIRARVTNLRALDSAVTCELVMDAVCAEFQKKYGNCEIICARPQSAEIQAEYKRLKSREWRFGKSPEFTHHVAGRFAWGGIEICLTVQKACVIRVSIYSDALDEAGIAELHRIFDGAEYNSQSLAVRLRESAAVFEGSAAAQMLLDVAGLL